MKEYQKRIYWRLSSVGATIFIDTLLIILIVYILRSTFIKSQHSESEIANFQRNSTVGNIELNKAHYLRLGETGKLSLDGNEISIEELRSKVRTLDSKIVTIISPNVPWVKLMPVFIALGANKDKIIVGSP